MSVKLDRHNRHRVMVYTPAHRSSFHMFAQKDPLPFAEGMGDDEKVGETLHIKDQDVIQGVDGSNGDGSQPFVVNVPQKHKVNPDWIGPARTNAKKPFAEGMGPDEVVGETLHINDNDVISGVDGSNGDGSQPLVVNVPQKKGRKPFAEGMGDDEKVGETLNIKDQDVIGGVDGSNGDGSQPFVVNVPQKHTSFAQVRKPNKWAEGMEDDEKVEETLRINDDDVITGHNDADAEGATPLTVNVPQKNKPKKWAEGMEDDEKVEETLRINDDDVITDHNNADAEGATPLTVNVPQKKSIQSFAQFEGVPIGSAVRSMQQRYENFAPAEYVQMQEPLAPGSGFPNALANDEGANLLGKPGLPTQSTLSAAPEKEWQQWAQDFVDWEDNQTDMANTRLPYASTLLQLQEPVAAGSGYPNTLAPTPGPLAGKPGLPSQSLLTAEPEKEWQQWAQDFVDWEDNQTDMANTRLPYASTLVQLNDHHLPDANTDIGVAIVDSILAEVPSKSPEPMEELEKVEDDMLDMNLVQMRAPNDDPAQLEDFVMEDSGIPLNMRLVQTD